MPVARGMPRGLQSRDRPQGRLERYRVNKVWWGLGGGREGLSRQEHRIWERRESREHVLFWEN